MTNPAWTSTNRPTNPVIGQIILETDTGKMMVYMGLLGWRTRWNHPQGDIGAVTLVANVIGISAGAPSTWADIAGLSTPIPQPGINRILQTRVDMTQSQTTNSFSSGIRVSDGLSSPKGFRYESLQTSVGNPKSFSNQVVTREVTLAGGSLSRKAQASYSTGSNNNLIASSTQPALLLVQDVGSAAVPVMS